MCGRRMGRRDGSNQQISMRPGRACAKAGARFVCAKLNGSPAGMNNDLSKWLKCCQLDSEKGMLWLP